jgi:hypothetical protein
VPDQLKGFEAHIKLHPDACPHYNKLYQQPPAESEKIEEAVGKMKAKYLIERDQGKWSANPLLTDKKTGEKCFYINYFKLNKESVGNIYPLSHIDNMFNAISGTVYFSTLDTTSGYWQIPLRKKNHPILGFTTRERLFQPQVLMFGIKNAPAIWQRTMNTTFEGLL